MAVPVSRVVPEARQAVVADQVVPASRVAPEAMQVALVAAVRVVRASYP